MGEKRPRPCPRGLYHGCPIPRELCREGFQRSGAWNCLELLRDFEWFVFSDRGEATGTGNEASPAAEGVASLEELIRVLEDRDQA